MESLSVALPNLEILTLGDFPCRFNTYPTTIRSFLSLSIHCTKLRRLGIHFRTEKLEVDILLLLGYAYSRGLHSRPKCPLELLVVGDMDIKVQRDDPALVVVALGTLMIFPSLTTFTSSPRRLWTPLGVLMEGLRKAGEPTVAFTEALMNGASQLMERVENGNPVYPVVSFCLPIKFVAINGILCYSQRPSLVQDEVVRIVCEPLRKLSGGNECGTDRGFDVELGGS